MQYIQSFNNHHSLCIIQTNHIQPANICYVAIYVFFLSCFSLSGLTQGISIRSSRFGLSSATLETRFLHHQNPHHCDMVFIKINLAKVSHCQKYFFLSFLSSLYVFVFFIFGVSLLASTLIATYSNYLSHE